MKKSVYLPQFALASSVLFSVSIAAAPTITSAVIADDILEITGTGFGTKATAEPTFFQPFTDLAEDDTPDDAGFDSWVDRGGEVVTLLDGVGGGSLRNDPELANNAFPHVGRYLPSGTQEVYLRFYFKLYQNPTSPVYNAQLKFARAGVASGIGPVEDYGMAASKFSQSLFIGDTNELGENSILLEWRDDVTVGGSYYPEENGGGGTGVATSAVDTSEWVYAEVHYKLNDVGVANGIARTTINGYDWHNRTALEPRTSLSDDIGYIQPIPSMDLDEDGKPYRLNDYDYAISRVYIDTGADSAAHVYLCNTDTAAACEKKFLLPPTEWSAGTYITTTAANIPDGYDWLYVTNAAGEVNSAGYEYTPGC